MAAQTDGDHMQTQNPDEQSDARERRIRAELQLTIFRRRPVIGDVLLLSV